MIRGVGAGVLYWPQMRSFVQTMSHELRTFIDKLELDRMLAHASV